MCSVPFIPMKTSFDRLGLSVKFIHFPCDYLGYTNLTQKAHESAVLIFLIKAPHLVLELFLYLCTVPGEVGVNKCRSFVIYRYLIILSFTDIK